MPAAMWLDCTPPIDDQRVAAPGQGSAGHPVTGCGGVLFGDGGYDCPGCGVSASWVSVAVRPAAGEWPGAVRRVVRHPASWKLSRDENRSGWGGDTGGLAPHR